MHMESGSINFVDTTAAMIVEAAGPAVSIHLSLQEPSIQINFYEWLDI
jgi:hypothetical protein